MINETPKVPENVAANRERNWGGLRPGQGRPIGSKNKTTRAAQVLEKHREMLTPIVGEQIASMSPLEIMLHAAAVEASRGNWINAAHVANNCAPYFHPKLSAIDVKTTSESKPADELSDEELMALIRAQAVVTVHAEQHGAIGPKNEESLPGAS